MKDRKRFVPLDEGGRMETEMKKNRFFMVLLVVMLVFVSTMPAHAATKVTVPKKITLNKTSVKLNVGKTVKLTVSYTPSGAAKGQTVRWSSGDKKVAAVSGGKVTAKAPGTTTITAKVGTKTAKCKVTVKAPLQAISLNKSKLTLTVGKSQKLSVSYQPANTTSDKTVTWSSSKPKVASVSGGKVSAKKAGTAVITAVVGSKTAKCTVTVKKAASSADTKDYLDVSQAYSLLNTFRTTKSNQWYWNESNTAKVRVDGLKSLAKDAALEKTAMLRAKEQWIMFYERNTATHTRPDGSSCFTAYPANCGWMGENLAWKQTSCEQAINSWAETNEDYSGQGHRRNMLNGNFTKVGIACYAKDGKTCWAMCLGSD